MTIGYTTSEKIHGKILCFAKNSGQFQFVFPPSEPTERIATCLPQTTKSIKVLDVLNARLRQCSANCPGISLPKQKASETLTSLLEHAPFLLQLLLIVYLILSYNGAEKPHVPLKDPYFGEAQLSCRSDEQKTIPEQLTQDSWRFRLRCFLCVWRIFSGTEGTR